MFAAPAQVAHPLEVVEGRAEGALSVRQRLGQRLYGDVGAVAEAVDERGDGGFAGREVGEVVGGAGVLVGGRPFSVTARDDDWWAAFTRGDVPQEAPERARPTRTRAHILLTALGRTAPVLTLSQAECATLAPLLAEWFHTWLTRQCLLQRPGHGLYPFSGIKTEAHRNGRARTDGAFARRGHFKGHGEWSDPDGILMALEITVRDHDTNQRDRIDKPLGYAGADIPVYLLIDRDNNTITVYSEPKDGRYQQSPSYPWGATVEIPSPVNITLDTEKLKDYAD